MFVLCLKTVIKFVFCLQNADKYPPPWLIAMQRYGPPPSYPNLKIPGLNAPIPEVSHTQASSRLNIL